MASFAQDILELGALKANLPLFKQRICTFVEKRTGVMVMLNKLAKAMDANDARTYKLVEGNKRLLKQHEMKARNLCGHIEQDKGPSVKILSFFDD